MVQERIIRRPYRQAVSPEGGGEPCATSPTPEPAQRAPSQRLRPKALRRPGFTLIELVVVVALTSILLLLLLGPVGQALNLTSRGQALVAGQDNVRHAQARIYRELTQAMLVHLDRPVNIWQYSQYDPRFTDFPQPTDASIPQRYQINGACMDVILPLHVYYDPHPNDGSPPHHLIPGPAPQGDGFSPLEVLDSCPRHPGSPLEFQALQPLQPEPVWVRYFIALKQPGYTGNPPVEDEVPPGQPSNLPRYLNGFLFQNVTGTFNNLYVLYRAEFDPTDPATANWRLAVDPQTGLPQGYDSTTGSGQPYQYDPNNPNKPWALNPNFFYDQTPIPNDPAGRTYSQVWKLRSVPVMSLDNSDVIHFVAGNDTPWMPESLVHFLPTPIEDEAAQPNRRPAAIATGATLTAADIAPVEHVAENGHWMGLLDDLGIPVPPNIVLSNSQPAGANNNVFRYGPRIRVFELNDQQQQLLAYDSADPTVRRRMVSYDSRRGVVSFAIPRSHDPNKPVDPNPSADPAAWNATLESQPDGTGGFIARFTAQLQRDVETRNDLTLGSVGGQLPTAFGSALAQFGNMVPPVDVHVVPGSETVQVVEPQTGLSRSFRRVGWSGISDSLNHIVAPPEIGASQYTIDYTTGIITLSEQDADLWSVVGPTQAQQLWIRYQFQTNRSSDSVRLAYSTRELVSTDVGVDQYAARTSEGLIVQTNQRVRVRNMTR